MDLASLQVGEQLGRGAMGVVHRAFDPASQRHVALKILLSGSADRFEREGVLSARLDHPSIVRIHASGVREGRQCLVYELVEGGKTLNDALLQGLPLAEALVLLRDTARGLGHAHARGIVHRDVKPENVLIDSAGHAKVADFGLAASKGLDQLTVTGSVLGTPLYMAPETLGGLKDKIGPPTDVWALGAMLYEILAGLPPYAADSLVTLSVQVIGAPVPPVDPQRDAPEALVDMARRALEKEPGDRFPDGDAFADALDAYLRGDLAPSLGSGRWLLRLGLLFGVLGGAALAGFLLSRGPADLPSSSPVGLAGASPSATPSGSPAMTPTPRAPLGDVKQLARIEDPLERYLALSRWVKLAPRTHAEREKAVHALRRSLYRPLQSGVVWKGSERVVAAFAPGGRVLAAGQRRGQVTCWRGESLEWSTRGVAGRAGALELPAGEALWWTAQPLKIRVCSSVGEKASARKLGRRQVRYVSASPDSKRLAMLTLSRLLIVAWPSGELKHRVPLPTRAHALLFDAAGDVWVGLGRREANSLTNLDGRLFVVEAESGKIRQRSEIRAGSVPLCLARDPLSGETLLGLSSGDVLRFDAQAQKLGSVPPFATDGLLNRTFSAGVKTLVFNAAGDRLWVAVNDPQKTSFLIEIDWREKRLIQRVDLSEETETLTLSRDETLLLRGNRAGEWELWAASQ